MASGYWQCKMAGKDKIKTAFTTHKGLYQFKVLPFGLCNAPATFQRLVNLVLGKFQWQKCQCYLDDIIVFGDTFELALENLQSVFNSLRKANLKSKPKKCVLFHNHVKFLGHVVSDQGISCDEDKIQTVLDVSEVRGLLGLAGYYRRFIPNFSTVLFAMTRLTQKNRSFVWDESCQKSF